MTPAQTSPVAESVELLPCPFCGGDPRRYTANPYPGFEDRQVQCDQCGASAFDSKWNTRADPAIAASYEAGRAEGVREAAEVCERKSKALMAKANGPSFLTEITRGMAGVAKDNATAIRALSKEPTK